MALPRHSSDQNRQLLAAQYKVSDTSKAKTRKTQMMYPSYDQCYENRCQWTMISSWMHYHDVSYPFPYAHSITLKLNQSILIALVFFSIASAETLIGDFSKPFCLPLTEGRHSDLKSISVHTMAKLIRGEYTDSVASFKVIDCRYPYEFEGGHIRGAHNLYTQEQIITELVNTKTELPKVTPDGQMRNIIVFHCEFSSERGPKL